MFSKEDMLRMLVWTAAFASRAVKIGIEDCADSWAADSCKADADRALEIFDALPAHKRPRLNG